MDILELSEIPRERDKLRAVIGTARYERRKSRIIRFVSLGLVALGCIIVLFSCSAPAKQREHIYIPLVTEGAEWKQSLLSSEWSYSRGYQ